MSLINDALKRASQAQPPPPLPTEPHPVPLEPVLYSRPSKLPMVVLPLLFVAVLGLGIWFLVKGWEVAHYLYASNPVTVAAREPSPDQRAATTPAPAPAEAMPPPRALPPEAVPGPTAEAPGPSGEAVPAPEAAVEQAISVPSGRVSASFPELKLQALFYRRSNPAVVINTKTLFVGDTIEGAKIVSVERETVVVEWQGQTRALRLR